MAGGFPQIQSQFSGAGTPPSKQQPQIQSPMSALLGGRGYMGGGFGAQLSPMVQAAMRRKTLMQGFGMDDHPQGAGYFPSDPGDRGPGQGRDDMTPGQPQYNPQERILDQMDKPYQPHAQEGYDPERNIRRGYPGLYPVYRQPGQIEREMKGDWLPQGTAERVSQGAIGLRGFGGPARRMGGGQGFGEGGAQNDVLRRLLMGGQF